MTIEFCLDKKVYKVNNEFELTPTELTKLWDRIGADKEELLFGMSELIRMNGTKMLFGDRKYTFLGVK